MAKNLVVGMDGTWNSVLHRTGGHSNIPALLSWVNRSGQSSTYIAGVGNGLGTFGQVLYGALGRGVFSAARQGWQWLHLNYEPGDQIFIFGFSRGAFAARHLASMIVRHGLKGWRGDIETEFRKWQRTVHEPPPTTQTPVHMLGLFDCVPGNQFYVMRDRSHYLNSGKLEPGILNVRHAVAIHERRWSFAPVLFERGSRNDKAFDQRWFPGYHSDVGGGGSKKVANGLAAFSLWWMMREAHGLGLELNLVNCPKHYGGTNLNVIQAIDLSDPPRCSDWLSTRLGLKVERESLQLAHLVGETPDFFDLDECYRCKSEMFDALISPEGQRRIATLKKRS
ncbi:DUF2235 domain-containing protein [Massilia sp. DD77]|uniref:DUF2235 domain-containing protein n=1 Tax=Massilia sp. DD77 TaxID=3109349 RepID=UPI0030007408